MLRMNIKIYKDKKRNRLVASLQVPAITLLYSYDLEPVDMICVINTPTISN